MKLQLDRPLIVFDIESTGVNARQDRIIELAAIRIEAAARRRWRRMRWLAAAAGLALLLGGGIWQFGMQRTAAQPREANQPGDVALVDEGEIVLDIIGLAEPLELEAFQVAQL